MKAVSGTSRWTGAGSIPARDFGYVQATIPLVGLELTGPRLELRLRPTVLAMLVKPETLAATPSDALEIFPVRNNATWQGLEFRRPGHSSFYFFLRHREEAVAALTRAGFTVSAEAGRERLSWFSIKD